MSNGFLRSTRRWLGFVAGAWMLAGPAPDAAAALPPSQPLYMLSAAARQPAQPSAPSRYLPRRMRKNTISVGGQAQYGLLSGGSELDDHYDSGPGYTFRARYMFSSRSAICFSFENQQFDAIPTDAVPSAAEPDSHLVITTVAAEGTFFFHRDRETHPYLLAGFGYASPDVHYQNAGTRRVNEGPFLVLGVGGEHFIRPRFSVDAGIRGFAQIGNSELSLVTEFALGIHLYPGD
jgi:hypothetical protein